MKKIFLSTSFAGQVNHETRDITPELRTSLELILKALREQPDVEVFCAAEQEGWKISDALPDNGVMRDITEIDTADIFVALMHDKPSASVQFEIGYAVGKGKKVVLAVKAGEELAYYNQGLVSGGLVTYVAYDDVKSLITQLPIAINAPEDLLAGASA
ncbi:MAG: nucleoside 2-deoxyribosyltransferase [Candidatus Saccharimonadales bacterium]